MTAGGGAQGPLVVGQGPLAVVRGEGVLEFVLSRPKANVIDGEMIRALSDAVSAHLDDRHVRAVLLRAVGPHFSFGASVEEHRPAEAPAMLAALHGLFSDILDSGVPWVAAVRGQCLGGALELVLCCSYVVAAPDAKLGCPEIRLGVFAPFASCVLPRRIGLAHAEPLLLSGAAIDAARARDIGLVHGIADDPEAAARAWIAENLLPKSASSLEFALRAARSDLSAWVARELPRLERLYLDDLLATHDAREGIESFIEKRPPRWKNE